MSIGSEHVFVPSANPRHGGLCVRCGRVAVAVIHSRGTIMEEAERKVSRYTQEEAAKLRTRADEFGNAAVKGRGSVIPRAVTIPMLAGAWLAGYRAGTAELSQAISGITSEPEDAPTVDEDDDTPTEEAFGGSVLGSRFHGEHPGNE